MREWRLQTRDDQPVDTEEVGLDEVDTGRRDVGHGAGHLDQEEGVEP